MYKCRSPKIVFDPFAVFPSYSESEIKISYDEGGLYLKIFYDDENTQQDKCVQFQFPFPVFHRFGSFPGMDGMDIKCDKYESLGSLVEFSHSEYRDAWEKHFENITKLYHYRIFFPNENKRLEIVSEEVRIFK